MWRNNIQSEHKSVGIDDKQTNFGKTRWTVGYLNILFVGSWRKKHRQHGVKNNETYHDQIGWAKYTLNGFGQRSCFNKLNNIFNCIKGTWENLIRDRESSMFCVDLFKFYWILSLCPAIWQNSLTKWHHSSDWQIFPLREKNREYLSITSVYTRVIIHLHTSNYTVSVLFKLFFSSGGRGMRVNHRQENSSRFVPKAQVHLRSSERAGWILWLRLRSEVGKGGSNQRNNNVPHWQWIFWRWTT